MYETLSDLLAQLKQKRLEHPKGHKSFNNRVYDPFHLFSNDYNPNKITKITKETEEYYFPFPECYFCSVDKEPRPQPCAMSEKCHFFVHYRGDKFLKEKSPIVECKLNGENTIFLSRTNLSFILKYQLSYIFRATRGNGLIFHHLDRDQFNDRSENIVVVKAGWHTGRHNKIEAAELRIKKNMQIILENKTSELVTLASIERKVDEQYRDELLKIGNDALAMKIIIEIDERIKANLFTLRSNNAL